MKKFITLLITTFIVFGCIFAFSGCSKIFTPKLYTDGYFTYHKYSDNTVEIVNLSELGKQQEYIVIPTEIQGMPVGGIGDKAGLIWGYRDTYWESDNLKKIYVTKYVSVTCNQVFDGCPNLTRIIAPYLVSGLPIPDNAKEFSPRIPYEKLYTEVKYLRPANISFYWNYENADNDGYYWIDDIEYGEHITLIPDDPVRSGYTFTGWYKEPECINLWDFESDTAPAPQFDSDLNTIYQETCLYSGWR